MHKLGIWVEVTTLLLPGVNDSEEEISAIANFISSIDNNMPWHVSRFHPDYQFSDYPSTPEETLKRAVDNGLKAGLRFIYAGNIYGWGNDTFCPVCKKLLIKREVFSVLDYNIKDSKCLYCQALIPGVFI
jgi:pyruvate formate lyase activating enzyme